MTGTLLLYFLVATLYENKRIVAADPVVRGQYYRITLTPEVFNNATFVLFLVTGESKVV